MSATAFLIEAVPLKDTTICVLLHATKHRVSNSNSQNSSLCFRSYRLIAVGRLRTVRLGLNAAPSSDAEGDCLGSCADNLRLDRVLLGAMLACSTKAL